jgi:hypothetical protein
MFKTPWEGWGWYEDYLVDPDGNRYSPEMIKTSIYTMQLQHALTGYPSTVKSLKKELERRIKANNPTLKIIFNGHEIDVKLPDF